jgi:competence protein ComFB
MKIANYMEDVTANILSDLLKRDEYKRLAGDEKIKLDILAFALNRLPPKYVVTERGHVYTKLNELREQFKTNILVEITKAIQHVESNISNNNNYEK